MKKPKRKKDWVGRYVRLRYDKETNGGKTFEAGSIMRVTRNFGGLNLEAPETCPSCGLGDRHYIIGVSEHHVELLPEAYKPRRDKAGRARKALDQLKALHNDLHDILETDIGGCLGGIAGGCGACELCTFDELVPALDVALRSVSSLQLSE